MNAITVCVDYGDKLSVTLPYNRHHFDRYLVVTTPNDKYTQEIAIKNDAEVYTTIAFYEDGALFNKFKSLEQGLDVLGRKGWLCILDADILWPKSAVLCDYATKEIDKVWGTKEPSQIGCIYTPLRHMVPWPTSILLPEKEWYKYPLHPQQVEWAGYTQIFHADDTHLPNAPWHQIDWKHAGGADSFFQALWPQAKKLRPLFEVLHLGCSGVNWAGVQDRNKRELQSMLEQRKGKYGMERFEAERIVKRESPKAGG